MDVFKFENFLRNDIVPQLATNQISLGHARVISEWYKRLENCPDGIIEWMIENDYLLNVGKILTDQYKYAPNIGLIDMVFRYQVKLANERVKNMNKYE